MDSELESFYPLTSARAFSFYYIPLLVYIITMFTLARSNERNQRITNPKKNNRNI